MATSLTLVALLFKQPDADAELELFESSAAALMRRHGGAIERRVQLTPSGPGEPDEVHLVTFPSAAAFAAYRDDRELHALQPLRERAIRRTVVWQGHDAAPFAPPDPPGEEIPS